MNSLLAGIIIAAAAVIIVLVVVLLVLRKSIKNMETSIDRSSRETADVQNAQIIRQNEQLEVMNMHLANTMNQVSKSLGEMQNLAGGVDDLRRIMTNIKTRGVLGELQLGAILSEILSPEQYDENVAVKGGTERVEFAVKFPAEDGGFVYLPIDSKFPGDAYLKLLDAYDTGDRELIRKATDGLRYAILKAAKDIRTKYIYPPYTTEFGIMFLPFEGLYAEVLRLGLIETLQNEYRINVAGPTTMAAILNSFQLGFKSLALQQSSGEVWDTLEKVKSEFMKFEEVLAKTQFRLDQTQKELETLVGARTRSIKKALDNASKGID